MRKNYKKRFGKEKSNMKTLYRPILKVVLVIFIMGTIGCTAGPAYQKVEKIPENSSVVYIYRPGFAGWPEVKRKSQESGPIRPFGPLDCIGVMYAFFG